MKRVLFAALFVLVTHAGMAQIGALDPSFGNGGIVKTDLGKKDLKYGGTPLKILTQPDGKLLIAQELYGQLVFSRHEANGALDTTFANKGLTASLSVQAPYSVAFHPNGNIFIASPSSPVFPGAKVNFKLLCLNTDGSFEIGFGKNGIIEINFDYPINLPSAIAIQPDGKIIVAGTAATNTDSDGIFAVARFNANGSLDTSFNGDGKTITDFGFRVLGVAASIDSLGKLIVAGNGYSSGLDGDVVAARYLPNGTLDSTFGSSGKTTASFYLSDDAVQAIALDGNNNIVLAGKATFNGRRTQFMLMRIEASGALDKSFNKNGFLTADFGNDNFWYRALIIQKDNKIVVSGASSSSNHPSYAFSRYNVDGSADMSFNGTGVNTFAVEGYLNSFISTLSLQADGKLLAGGLAANYFSANHSTMLLAKYNTDGVLDVGFGQKGKVAISRSSDLISSTHLFTVANEKILLGGSGFLKDDHNPFFTRYNKDGSTDTTFAVKGVLRIKGTSYVSSLVQTDGKIITVGNYIDALKNYVIVRYKADGKVDSTYAVNGVNIIVPPSDNVVAFGWGEPLLQQDNNVLLHFNILTFEPFSSVTVIARYNEFGKLDSSFGTNGKIESETNFSPIYKQKDDKFWIYYGMEGADQNTTGIVRYLANGRIDSSFGRNGNGKLVLPFAMSSNITEQKNGDFIVIGHLGSGLSATQNLYRLNNKGVLDSTFGRGSQPFFENGWIVVQPDDKIIRGGIQKDGYGRTKTTLTRHTSNGAVDSAFGINGMLITDIDPSAYNYTGMGVIEKNRLYVLGSTRNVDQSGFVAAHNLKETPKKITCPINKKVSTDKGICAAKVFGIDPSGSTSNQTVHYKLSGATQGQGTGTASGQTFKTGVTYVSYTSGSDTTTCRFAVTVTDTEPPTLTPLRLTAALTRINFKNNREITINYDALDNCGIATIQIGVTDIETGDSSTIWKSVDGHRISIANNALAKVAGKSFKITVAATDLSGNTTSQSVSFTMPKGLGQLGVSTAANLTVAVFPNPTRGHFLATALSNDAASAIQIQISNAMGTMIESRKVASGTPFRFGSNYKVGIYYLKAKQGKQVTTIRLIKLPG